MPRRNRSVTSKLRLTRSTQICAAFLCLQISQQKIFLTILHRNRIQGNGQSNDFNTLHDTNELRHLIQIYCLVNWPAAYNSPKNHFNPIDKIGLPKLFAHKYATCLDAFWLPCCLATWKEKDRTIKKPSINNKLGDEHYYKVRGRGKGNRSWI